jgi:hypothetical protein
VVNHVARAPRIMTTARRSLPMITIGSYGR